MSNFQKKYEILLKDFGYRMEGRTLICNGVRGFLSERIIGKFRDAFDACEYLIPVIKDSEFSKRVHS